MEGFCQNPECHKPIQWSGKERMYCNNPACRQRMHRMAKTQQALADLQERWQPFDQCIVENLKDVLRGYGLRAAQLATRAVEYTFRHPQE